MYARLHPGKSFVASYINYQCPFQEYNGEDTSDLFLEEREAEIQAAQVIFGVPFIKCGGISECALTVLFSVKEAWNSGNGEPARERGRDEVEPLSFSSFPSQLVVIPALFKN